MRLFNFDFNVATEHGRVLHHSLQQIIWSLQRCQLDDVSSFRVLLLSCIMNTPSHSEYTLLHADVVIKTYENIINDMYQGNAMTGGVLSDEQRIEAA